MDGREIKYVTKRTRTDNGDIKEVILGKTGRIVIIEDEIRIMCGTTDVFRCDIENATSFMLLSGDGITEKKHKGGGIFNVTPKNICCLL